MRPEQWQLANDLFQAALDRAPEDRPAFLATACAGDEALRQHVERLVDAHERAGSFLNGPPLLAPQQLIAAGAAAVADPTLPAFDAGLDFRGTDRFHVVRRLGSGGMGVVYEVLDRTRDEVVALKTLHRVRPADLFRLKQEFRRLADIAHPNLVSLYELVIDDHACFFTMELVRGVDFVRYVNGVDASSASARADRIRRSLAQLVDAVAELHRHETLHRDIKPSNILVTAEGRVVLVDFGIATTVRGQDIENGEWRAGTPAYFAPERHRGALPSPSQDWYSVGVTLHEALTGRLPADHSVVTSPHTQDGSRPSLANAGGPDDVEAICRGLLDTDPSSRFSQSQIRRVLATSASATGTTSPDDVERVPFVGRSEQLAIVSEAWRTVCHEGRPQFVYVHGPSGIGKTALIDHFLQTLDSSGKVLVLRGRCYEHESVPYKALDGAVDCLTEHLRGMPATAMSALMPPDVPALTRLFPVLLRVVKTATAVNSTATSDAAARSRAFAALREIVRRLGAHQPLVLFIDDLQWADADGISLLTEVVRAPDAPVMLTMVCARGDERAAQPYLATLLEATGARVTLPVGAMNATEARILMTATSGGAHRLTDHELDTIAQESDGNPFLLRQFVKHISAPRSGPARTLAEALLDPVRELSDDAWPFLQMLALCGRPMPTDLIFAGVGRQLDRPLVRRLRTNHLVRSSGSADSFELYHDRIRETVVALTPRDEQRRLHNQMVQALLAARIDDPDALYIHSREAGDQQAASGHAAAAARRAEAALAFRQAAEYYRAALELTPRSESRVNWQEGLATALANAGRPVASADAYLSAAESADATVRFDLRRRAAEQFLLGGHIDRGLATMRGVLRAVGLRMPAGPQRTVFALGLRRARLRWRGLRFVERPASALPPATLLQIDTCWSAASGLALVDSLRAALFQTQCLLLALDAGEPYRIARSLATEVGFSAIGGGPSRRSTGALAQAAESIATTTANPHAIALSVLMRGVAAFMVGEWATSGQLCQKALGMLREQTGVVWDAALAERILMGSLMYEGRIRDVTTMTFRLLESARENGHAYWDTELRTGQSLVWLARDSPAEAIQQADTGIGRWSQEGFHRQHYNHVLAHVQVALYEGRANDAWQLFEARRPAIRRSLVHRIQWTRIESSYWRARCALLVAHQQHRDTYLSIVHREASRIEDERMAWSTPVVSLLRATASHLDGDRAVARQHLVQAVEGFDRAGMALHAAVARRRFSELADDELATRWRQDADEWMRLEGIVNPGRMTRLVAPGFHDDDE